MRSRLPPIRLIRSETIVCAAVLAGLGVYAHWMPRTDSTAPTSTALPGGTAEVAIPASFRNGFGLTMVWVPAQSVVMGSRTADAAPDERPHVAEIGHGFWIASTEVTRAQWARVLSSAPWRNQDDAVPPTSSKEAGAADSFASGEVAASGMTWSEAVTFCEALTVREWASRALPDGHVYRLPTEAEWELACRAGSEGDYCCHVVALPSYAVYADARDGAHPHRVASRRANAWGLFDMHGNVWEWCLDAAATRDTGRTVEVVTDTYRNGAFDPCGRVGNERVCRGGSFAYSAPYLRSANRMACAPDTRGTDLGLRVVLARSTTVPASRRER
ncbi:MAG: SUMF1/EgtB/PvdO family nonheme iron enzyme [Planctomycetota bacterium]